MRLLLLTLLMAPAALAQTWAPQTSGTANDFNNVFARSSSEAYAAGDNGTLLRTTDGGATWTQLAVGGFDFEGVGFNPANPIGIVATDNGPVLRTTDGVTFNTIFTGSNDNLRDVSWGTDTVVFSVGREGDALRSTDGGLTWTVSSIANIERLDAISAVSATQAWVVGELGQIFVTTNGTTWTAQNSGTGADLSDVFMVDASTGYAVGSNNTILKTTNGGATWTNVSNGNADGDGVHFLDANTGWVVDNFGLIWFTDNGGATWVQQASGVSANLNGVHFANATSGWAVGDAGAITHFTAPATGCEAKFTSADLAYDAGTRVLSITGGVRNNGSASVLLRLELRYNRDGGNPQGTRVLANGTLPGGASAPINVNLNVPSAAPGGNYNFTLALVDTGAGSDCATYVETIAISAPRVGASQSGELFEVAEVADFSVMAEASASAAAPVAVAPNPFARQTTISYEVAAPADVRLAVYDVLGREVAVLVDARMDAGTHSAVFNASDLAAGTYVYRLQVGSDVRTGRMTLAR
ncbi:MAG: YCF48-related protein [Rubricoccaceae bacterium]|nr:YCF48-related protein [Rubricoccaceae bacterium]